VNGRDWVIDAINNTHNGPSKGHLPVDETLEPEVGVSDEAPPSTRDGPSKGHFLCKQPWPLGGPLPEGDPHVDQEETQGHEHKSNRGIGGGGPAAGVAGAAIAGLNPEWV